MLLKSAIIFDIPVFKTLFTLVSVKIRLALTSHLILNIKIIGIRDSLGEIDYFPPPFWSFRANNNTPCASLCHAGRPRPDSASRRNLGAFCGRRRQEASASRRLGPCKTPRRRASSVWHARFSALSRIGVNELQDKSMQLEVRTFFLLLRNVSYFNLMFLRHHYFSLIVACKFSKPFPVSIKSRLF